MIPCSGSEIHRWNALDDLDDDISDRVNDDLIPYDDDEDDLQQYDDPSLLLTGSFFSSDSTVDDSNDDRIERNHNSSSDFSSHIDEDGLILALDDSTNRMTRNRRDGLTKGARVTTNSNSSDVVTVRIKKSLKYGKQKNVRMTATNGKEVIRSLPSNSRDIVPSDIHRMYSDGTMNSLTPTEEELNQRKNNVVTVRVKKSVKYGNKENIITNYKNIPGTSTKEIVQRPQINTIHSDGTISSVSPTEQYGSLVEHKPTENPKPRVATIYSDGSIGYNDEKSNAIVERPVQSIATINSDGTITYRLGNEIGRNETAMVVSGPPSVVATIHSDGLISYRSVKAKISSSLQTALTPKSASFENVVTDTEDCVENAGEDDNEDMDDDICDNVDDSRYTRSLHSMPVLEEVTEEESPLHSEDKIRKDPVSSTPQESAYKRREEPTWLELKQSPSATTFMTPRRTNDDLKYDTTSDNVTSRWLGFKGLGSSHKKNKRGAKYQSMENSTSALRSFSERKAFQDTANPSRKHLMLRVETCSTGSHSEKIDSTNDLEAGDSSGAGRVLCWKKPSSREGYQLSNDDEGSFTGKTKSSFCFRRRNWILALAFVLIGITVGVSSYFIMHTVFADKEEDREKDLVEEWTMVEETPWGSVHISNGPKDSTTSNDIETNPVDVSTVPSNAPIDVVGSRTSSPTPFPTFAKKFVSPPIGDGMFLAIQDTERINNVIRRARREIELLIFDDNDLIGKFLRLVFHDCVGGCDGCVDMTNPKNNGLDKPIDALQPVVDQFEPEGLSRTDVWMMASLVASELALPFASSDLLFPLHWIGRQTCESRFAKISDPVSRNCGLDFEGNPTPCSSKKGPHVEQPHGTLGTTSIQKFFNDEFGFNAQQVTAIMGAHSVGRMARENVGFTGLWDLSTTTLDSGYWQELVGSPPDFFVEKIDNSDLPNIPDRHQWRGIIEDLDFTTVVMLNVDVALVRNIEDMDEEGNVGCAGPGILLKDCPSDTPFLPFAKEYNANERKFVMDFRDVLTLMINHGNTGPTPLTVCPEGRICVFENGQNTFGTIGIALDELSMPPTPSPTGAPTPSPSRMPPKSFPEVPPGQPSVSLDRLCYDNVGDILVVTYDSIPGTDITLEVYSAEDVDILEGRTILDPRVANAPLKSTLSCGRSSCHTWTSLGGLQISTENLLGGGSDYVVLLFARSLGDPTGDLQLLAGDSFRLEGCDM